MIQYDTVRTDADLRKILALQAKNLPAQISLAEKQSEGFVTIHHDFELLDATNTPFEHVVARDGAQVVGCTLVRRRKDAEESHYLIPVFQTIDEQI
mgnify:CR=1 FL=1